MYDNLTQSDIDKMEKDEIHYDVIEVMACDGGCIAGGGGPKINKVTNIISTIDTVNIVYFL